MADDVMYSDEQKEQIIAADRARRTPTCPRDGAAMDVHAQRSLGRNSNVTIRCPRCARIVEYVRYHG
jgi:hypothetical protein